MGKRIGIITEVRGIKIKCKLFELLPPFIIENGELIQAPKINSLVKTKVGLDTIICQVSGEINHEMNTGISELILELDVKGFIDGGKFVQGLRVLPIVAASVSLLDNEDIEVIYQYDEKTAILLGKDIFETNRKIAVNVNHLVPSHIGIFGNTGSGKSNTLAKILSDYSDLIVNNRNGNSEILLFDLNNEYGQNSFTDINNKIIYSLNTRSSDGDKIPFNFNKLTEDDFLVILDASEKMHPPVIKRAYQNSYEIPKDERYYKGFIRSVLINSRRALFNSLKFYLGNYIKNLDNFIFHSAKDQMKFYVSGENEKKSFEGDELFSEALDNIRVTIPLDPLDRFFFELCLVISTESENGTNVDFFTSLLNRTRKIFNNMKLVFDFDNPDKKNFFGDKHIAVVQLANVNDDMKELIPAVLTSVIFNDAVESKGNSELKSITSIVIDEAHNLLNEGKSGRLHENVLQVFEKIIKEGRKFGVFVCIASQRPSDISTAIISQIHNYFIHKLVNPSDLLAIKKTVAFLDEKSLDFLTVLAPGECVVSGVAFQMPRFIYIDQLSGNKRPNSENIKLVGENGVFNSISKREALIIWEAIYKDAIEARDCFGEAIRKSEYVDQKNGGINSATFHDDRSWAIVFKNPVIFGGKSNFNNLQIVHAKLIDVMKNKQKFEVGDVSYRIIEESGIPRIYDCGKGLCIDTVYTKLDVEIAELMSCL